MIKEINWLLKDKYSLSNQTNFWYKGKPLKNFYPIKYNKAVILVPFKILNRVNKDIRRLKKGEPIDYIIGFVEFLGCKIDLSEKPLIPRQETEFWLAQAIDEIKNFKKSSFKDKKIKCLDAFSGSGCIGVAILSNTQNSLCDFTEIDKKFLKQININLKNNFIKKNRYNIIKSDIFDKVKEKYDFIFANPPYIPKTRKNKLPKSVLKFEPKIALFGGKNGLFYINRFLRDAKKYLKPKGKIFMEFDYAQKNNIENLLKKYNYLNYQFYKDQYSKWRWVMIK